MFDDLDDGDERVIQPLKSVVQEHLRQYFFNGRSIGVNSFSQCHIHPSGLSVELLNSTIELRIPLDAAKIAAQHLLQVMENVKHRTGIVTSHLLPLQNVAKEHNCIIGIRPVENVATGLIEAGHPTKGFHIKGKSANWGPQAGTICVNQAFSKLENFLESDPARIEKFNGYVRQCIEDGRAVAVPLVISRERMHTLLTANYITDMHLADTRGNIRFSAQAPCGGLYKFEATLAPGVDEGMYQISQQGQPLEVLAKTHDGKALTADYDLHLIGPHISDFGSQDNLPVADVAYEVFDARVNGHINRKTDSRPRNLAPELRQDYASAQNFYRREDADIGNATRRIASMISVINVALVGDGERVVQHSADSNNPASEPETNYPATYFWFFTDYRERHS